MILVLDVFVGNIWRLPFGGWRPWRVFCASLSWMFSGAFFLVLFLLLVGRLLCSFFPPLSAAWEGGRGFRFFLLLRCAVLCFVCAWVLLFDCVGVLSFCASFLLGLLGVSRCCGFWWRPRGHRFVFFWGFGGVVVLLVVGQVCVTVGLLSAVLRWFCVAYVFMAVLLMVGSVRPLVSYFRASSVPFLGRRSLACLSAVLS